MKSKRNHVPLLSLLIALLMTVSMAGCAKAPEEQPNESEDSSQQQIDLANLVFMNPLIPPEGSILRDDAPNLLPKVKEAYAENNHAVGWLQVPNTDIDEVVVKHPEDKSNSQAYYLRRGFDKKANQYGTYFVDYRNKVDQGRESFSKNTVIYGHSFTDNIDGLKMDQIKRLRASEEFARENPYVFFSTEEENIVWEIFAVYDTTVDMHYNDPDMTGDTFMEIVNDAVKRSYYTYDVAVNASDKILTLSTCTYNYTAVYPNNFRYVVMARMVQPDEKIKEEATLTVNAERKLAA